MVKAVRIWEVNKEDSLNELKKSKMDFEERLENWLENDISIISEDLLVIGRQVPTDFGGVIDLLCLDNNGDVVIVELKRDKTPREITAQALDYASWVNELTSEKINDIGNNYLKESGLERAFQQKFEEDYPDIVNEQHKILIVASVIDNSSERIINYLSDNYGIRINAITFHYFLNAENKEFLSRVFLIDPGEVEYKSKIRQSSKRKPKLTFEEFQEMADKKGLGEVYKIALEGLRKCFKKVSRYINGISFKDDFDNSGSNRSILALYIAMSDSEKGLYVSVYTDRLAELYNMDKNELIEFFPFYEKNSEILHEECGDIYFKTPKEVEDFLSALLEKQENCK